MFAEILEVLGPFRTEGRRISFPIPRCRERERGEKARAFATTWEEELIRDLAAHKSGPPTAEGPRDTKGGN